MTRSNDTRLGDFTVQADAYARARPGYPVTLVEQLLLDGGVGAGATVADLGAGTGIFTALLSGRGLDIHAVEPNQAMRTRAPRLSDVTWHDARFEALPFADGSLAWAVAAQAFHWAEPARALPEIHRVLAPGASFAILWNDRDVERSSLLTATRDAIGRLAPEFDEAYHGVDWPRRLTSTGHFEAPRSLEERHVLYVDDERFLDLFRSHNRLSATLGPARLRALLAELTELLDTIPARPLEVPYVCRAFVSRRALASSQ